MVERFRSAIWAQTLRVESKLTWERLNDELSSEMQRSHPGQSLAIDEIQRFFKRGDNPTAVRSGRQKVNLVELARRLPYGVKAAAAYDSELWALLDNQENQTLSLIDSACEEALGRIELTVLDGTSAVLLGHILGKRFPYQPDDESALMDGALRVAEAGTVDALMILGSQCRLALDRFSFIAAEVYSFAVAEAAIRLRKQIKSAFLAGGVETLIYRRLILRDWSEASVEMWLPNKLKRSPKRSSEPRRPKPNSMPLAMLHDPFGKLTLIREGMWPILPSDERLEWMKKNQSLLLRPAANRHRKAEVKKVSRGDVPSDRSRMSKILRGTIKLVNNLREEPLSKEEIDAVAKARKLWP